MTPAEEGAYIRLLAYSWNDPDCSLPDDDEELSRLSRLGEGWFNGSGKKVRDCFEKSARLPDRIFNKKQVEIRKKQKEWQRKSAEGGVKSGQSRRTATNQNGTNSEPPTEPMTQPPPKPKAKSRGARSSSPSVVREDSDEASGATAPPAKTAPDYQPDMIWDIGRGMLQKSGLPEASARGLLGKLVRDYGKENLARTIAATMSANPADPRTYLLKVLQNERTVSDAAKAKRDVGLNRPPSAMTPVAEVIEDEVHLTTDQIVELTKRIDRDNLTEEQIQAAVAEYKRHNAGHVNEHEQQQQRREMLETETTETQEAT